MKANFEDKNLVIRYLQQCLKETYNGTIHITGEYYKTFEMNYGFAHFIAKYLDAKYPILDESTKLAYKEHYENGSSIDVRSIYDCISISNYFLCSNTGKRLIFDHDDENKTTIYDMIYNKYMSVHYDTSTGKYVPNENTKNTYMVMNDLPLFTKYNEIEYSVNDKTIFNLSTWDIEKDICELDDFVLSFLFGRTITPNSSMEDIYYAQQLIYKDQEIPRETKGVWCLKGNEGTFYDMTQALIQYQKKLVNPLSNVPMFVTGYFDIYTEAALLREVGEDKNGIRGL